MRLKHQKLYQFKILYNYQYTESILKTIKILLLVLVKLKKTKILSTEKEKKNLKKKF